MSNFNDLSELSELLNNLEIPMNNRINLTYNSSNINLVSIQI